MKVAIIILIVFFFLIRKSKNNSGTRRPPMTEKPSVEVSNDKIILISNATLEDTKQALKAFCDQYNEKSFVVLPRVYTLSETEHAVTFPYDTTLTLFSFAINDLSYPVDIKWNADIHGWVTISNNEEIKQENLKDKLCLFYVFDDNEYDSVYVTSSDNFCFKLPFTNFKPKAITPPVELFKNQPQKLADLSNIPYEDIE